MKKTDKIDWREKAEQSERELFEARVACKRLKDEKDTACSLLDSRPTKEIETIVQLKVLPSWVGMLVLGMGIMFLSFAVAMNDRVAALSEPVIEYKLVPGHTVYINRTNSKCPAILKECQADYKTLRRKEKDREEGTTFVQ